MPISIAHLRAAGLSAEQIVKVLEEAEVKHRQTVPVQEVNESDIDEVIAVYDRYYHNYNLVSFQRSSIRDFLECLPPFEVHAAMAIACSRRPPRDVFKYFCGICWNKIKQQGAAP
jgi:hypothetical protein